MYKLYEFPTILDTRGSLIAIEGDKDIPFEIKRIYYIFSNTMNSIRGRHAHKTLKQILICVSGHCSIIYDDGIKRWDIRLSKPDTGLFIGPGIWREMYGFSKDTILLVLASDWYDESDYIRNYDDFLTYKKMEQNNGTISSIE